MAQAASLSARSCAGWRAPRCRRNEMSLKQLLGWSLPLVLSAVGAAVPTTQLTELRIRAEGSGSTVSIQASGAFTHTEYRPTDGLLLVDLPGVTPGRFANQGSAVNSG